MLGSISNLGETKGLYALLFDNTAKVLESDFSFNNAAEEIGFAQEDNRKTFSKEKLKPAKAPELRKPEAVTELMRVLQDEEAAKDLERMAKRIVDAYEKKKNPEEEAASLFSDPCKQYLLLTAAIHSAQAEGKSAVVEGLKDALAGLERKSGAAIKAGFNIVGATQEFAQDSASADAFRAVYQKAVLGEHKLGDLFKHVMERFGEDHFERGAALLTKALAEDLAAATPSREPAKLNEILQDLYQLQTIKTVLLRCQNACKRLFNFSQISLQPFALAKELIGLASEKTVTSWGLRDIAKRLHVDDDEQIGAFMADLMSAIRIMPPKVFPSDEHRLRAIDAAQECLDIAELGGST